MASLTRSGSQSATNPFFGDQGTNYASSGDNNGSGLTQDWYIHMQTLDAQYLRLNEYNLTTSSNQAVPAVTNNYVRVNYTVHTTDEIVKSGNFLGDQIQLQTLELVADSSAGGFGNEGVLNTSGAGIIRRAALKDGNGVILDPTGTCHQSGTVYLDSAPGSYDGTYDTSAQVNGILWQLIGKLPDSCETFAVSLVDL